MLNNIKKSLNHLARVRKFIGSSIDNFKEYYHTKDNIKAEQIYFSYKKNHDKFPVAYRSYSTASRLVSNMRNKTDLMDLVIADHDINGDLSNRAVLKFIKCGRGIKFGGGIDINSGYSKHKLIGGFICDFKFCPVRQHLNAQKRFKQINTELLAMYDKYGWCPVLITLTMPSIKPTPRRVRRAYNYLTRAWKKMSKYKTYNGDNRLIRKNKGILKGWIEKFEFTYNWLNNTIHPHLHIIGLVRRSYLTKQGSKYFVTSKQLLKDWQRATGDKKIKEVNIEAPYYKENGKRIHIQDCHSKFQRMLCIQHAVKEISKYTGKSVDFTKMPKLHLDFNSSKWVKSQSDKIINKYKCNRPEAEELAKSPQYKKKYLLKHINKRQLQSVNAFHALYKGLRGKRILHFGGYAAKFNHFYLMGGLKKYESKPKVIYYYKIISRFNFKYKDYSDKRTKLNKLDILGLRSTGNIVTSKKNVKKMIRKIKAKDKLKNMTYTQRIRMGFKNYLNLCKTAGLQFN